MKARLNLILNELRKHVPFTALGTLGGIAFLAVVLLVRLRSGVAEALFWTFHPLHVALSAMATVGMYRLHRKSSPGAAILVGYLGSIGIATLSDCLIPYAGETLLDLPNRGAHLGFIEKWWLVNPLAFAGIALGYFWPRTQMAHAGHVLISTWASLFHIIMALGTDLTWPVLLLIPVFLFLAVWIPCCTSDVVFPLLLAGQPKALDTVPMKQMTQTRRQSS